MFPLRRASHFRMPSGLITGILFVFPLVATLFIPHADEHSLETESRLWDALL